MRAASRTVIVRCSIGCTGSARWPATSVLATSLSSRRYEIGPPPGGIALILATTLGEWLISSRVQYYAPITELKSFRPLTRPKCWEIPQSFEQCDGPLQRRVRHPIPLRGVSWRWHRREADAAGNTNEEEALPILRYPVVGRT